jgi:GNAT superfamily N-acetyltransferase
MGVSIRKGQQQDIVAAFALVQELALYEKAPQELTTTKEQMLADGFGQAPLFGFFVAEHNGIIIGMSLYYFRYSTWKGKRLYLEDLIVTEPMRGLGAGKMLFEATVAEAQATQCTGMMWQVLDWNEPSIHFYKQYGTRFDAEWLNCHLDF